VTLERVEELFQRLDKDDDGSITAEELAHGLKQQNLDVGVEVAERIISHLARLSGKSGQRATVINLEQYDMLLTCMRMAELFSPTSGSMWIKGSGDPDDSPTCSVAWCDYRRKTCKKLVVGTDVDAQEFFFGPQWPGKGWVRWIHVDATRDLDRLSLLRLVVKYHLHPLAVDDILANRRQTKIDRFADHYFVSVDLLALAEVDSAEEVMKAQNSATVAPMTTVPVRRVYPRAPQRVKIHRSHVSIIMPAGGGDNIRGRRTGFVEGSQQAYDCLITVHQERPDESSWLSLWRRPSSGGERASQEDMWSRLQDDLLSEPARRMREQGADFLLYEVLDRIVSELQPISEAYARRLGFFHQHQHDLNAAMLNELSEVQLELVDLQRSIKPMRSVVRHFISEESRLNPASRMYMEDVGDTIDRMMDDVAQLQQMCRTLGDAHERAQDKRTNDTLFVLGVVSAIFLPAQTITGCYGMNFVDQGGNPGMPELTWQNGYLYFWVLQGVCLVVAVLLFATLHRCGLAFYRRLCPCFCRKRPQP